MSADYRKSHLAAGPSYDGNIATSPFDNYLAKWEATHLAAIVTRLFPSQVPRYLDFACGTGRILAQITPMAREAVGIDISSSMLAEATRRVPTARLVHGDLTRDSLSLGTFDLASAFRFFGNAQQELREDVLRAIRDVLTPRGYLLLNNHRNPRALSALLGRLRGVPIEVDLTHHKLRRTLEKTGFEIVERHPIGVWMFRASLTVSAGNDPEREARLERLFRSSWWSPIAPDTVILAQRI